MNNFLASGGDGFSVFNQCTDQLGGEVDLDALVRYFMAHSPGLAAEPQNRIKRLGVERACSNAARRARREAGPLVFPGYTGRLPMAPDIVDTTDSPARGGRLGRPAPTASSSPTTTRPSRRSTRGRSCTAPSCASTRTRCSSTSATSPRASSRSPSSRSGARSTRPTRSALGDEIDALVLTKEDAEGRLILSKKRARFELAWKTIEAGRRERRAGHRHA